MKRFAAIILALALVLGLAGCVSKEEKETAKSLSAMIDLLANADLEDAEDVQEAQDIYDSLSEKAQKRVKNYADLEAAHSRLAEIVIDMIDEIGTVTLESEAAIEAAAEAYGQLPEKAKALVINYAQLESADTKLLEALAEAANTVSDAIEEINTAMDSLDSVTICTRIPEILPLARQLMASKFYGSEEDPVTLLEDIQTLMEEICYPNTHIISLANYVKLADLYSGAADTEEAAINKDSKTGMEYFTYFCNSATDMSKTFISYTDNLKQYFEVDDVEADGKSARYYFIDDLERKFYVEWAYYNLDRYGSVYGIYVGFDPTVGIADAVKE